MRLYSFLYFFLFFCISTNPISFAQEAADTSQTTGEKNAKSDELYFDAEKAKMHDDEKQAKELLKQFIAARPEVSDGYYELSKIYYNDKSIDEAEANIKKAIDIDKDNKWYKEQYATILAERGADEEAAKIMADLNKSEPDDRSYPIMAADYYERAHKYDDAIKYLDVAIAQAGPDEELMMRKVQVYLSMNNVEKAAGIMKDLIAQDPRNGRYYKELGDLYDNNKLPEKAAEIYKNAQKNIPDDPSIQLGLAEHYLKLGDTQSYVAYVKKAIVNKDLDAENQLDILTAYAQSLPNDSVLQAQGLPIIRQIVAQHPADPDVLEVYGEFLEKNNKRDSAIIEFKRSLEIKPANFNVWARLLEEYQDREHADSLVKYSEKAIRLFPNQVVAHYYNGIGHFYRKEYPAAAKAINRAIDMIPENDKQRLADMYAVLGDIYHSNKQFDLADQTYDKVLKLDPDNPTVLNNYSYYLSERGVKLDVAEKMSKRSLELRPKEGTFLDTYGWILYKKGDYAKAKEYVEKAIELAGINADGTLYDHLGNIYYKLNDSNKALENWKIAKEKKADDPELDKKIREGKLYE